jgi:hypothetical protein
MDEVERMESAEDSASARDSGYEEVVMRRWDVRVMGALLVICVVLAARPAESQPLLVLTAVAKALSDAAEAVGKFAESLEELAQLQGLHGRYVELLDQLGRANFALAQYIGKATSP